MKRSASQAATPALATLASAGVWHRVYEYDHDSATDSYGHEAAQKLGIDPGRLYKTLIVTTPEGRLANAVLAVAHMLDLKRLAKALDVKSVEMADPKVAQRKTGYVLGGISPLGQKSVLPTILDSSTQEHQTIWVSGGRRGLSLELQVPDLVELTQGKTVDIRR